jgi:hypothetical protein
MRTSSEWYQKMYAGGSVLCLIVHVRLMVLPLSTCKSGPPKIVAVGTATRQEKEHQTEGQCEQQN